MSKGKIPRLSLKQRIYGEPLTDHMSDLRLAILEQILQLAIYPQRQIKKLSSLFQIYSPYCLCKVFQIKENKPFE